MTTSNFGYSLSSSVFFDNTTALPWVISSQTASAVGIYSTGGWNSHMYIAFSETQTAWALSDSAHLQSLWVDADNNILYRICMATTPPTIQEQLTLIASIYTGVVNGTNAIIYGMDGTSLFSWTANGTDCPTSIQTPTPSPLSSNGQVSTSQPFLNLLSTATVSTDLSSAGTVVGVFVDANVSTMWVCFGNAVYSYNLTTMALINSKTNLNGVSFFLTDMYYTNGIFVTASLTTVFVISANNLSTATLTLASTGVIAVDAVRQCAYVVGTNNKTTIVQLLPTLQVNGTFYTSQSAFAGFAAYNALTTTLWVMGSCPAPLAVSQVTQINLANLNNPSNGTIVATGGYSCWVSGFFDTSGSMWALEFDSNSVFGFSSGTGAFGSAEFIPFEDQYNTTQAGTYDAIHGVAFWPITNTSKTSCRIVMADISTQPAAVLDIVTVNGTANGVAVSFYDVITTKYFLLMGGPKNPTLYTYGNQDTNTPDSAGNSSANNLEAYWLKWPSSWLFEYHKD